MPRSLFALALALTTSFLAAAQDAPVVDPVEALTQRLEELEQEHRILARKLEIDAEKTTEAAKTKASMSVGEKGFTLQSADKLFTVKLKGVLQADGRAYLADDVLPLNDGFVLRRVRPTLEATFMDLVDVRLTPDFANSTVVLFDAWIDVRPRPWLKLRVGKFKPPVGLERLQSASWTHFVERASPTALVPNRDLGAQIFGDIAGGGLQYAFGVFSGGVDGAVNEADTNENKEIAGRIFTHPFRFADFKPLAGFGIGLAGTFGRQRGTAAANQLPSFRSPGQQTFFSYVTDAIANGNRTRWSPQAYLYVGPVGVLAEYVSSAQSVTRAGQTTRVDNAAWNTTVSFVITGEDASYDGVQAKKPFSVADGQPGAIELVARYHVLRVDQDVFNAKLANPSSAAQRSTSFGVGVNWFLNRNFRVSMDFERTWFVGGAAGTIANRFLPVDRPAENVLLARLQVSF